MAIQIFWEVTEKYTILSGNLINLNFWMAGGSPIMEFKINVSFAWHNCTSLLSLFK